MSAGTDNSVASRTGSYSMAMEFFTTSPVFGRGYSTFLPAYRIFDNQYRLLLVEAGLVGLVCVVTMLVLGVRDARRVRRVSTDAAVREHAQALPPAFGGALGLAFYDGFSFPMATGVMFVMLGMVVALYRLTGVASQNRRALLASATARRRAAREAAGPACPGGAAAVTLVLTVSGCALGGGSGDAGAELPRRPTVTVSPESIGPAKPTGAWPDSEDTGARGELDVGPAPR